MRKILLLAMALLFNIGHSAIGQTNQVSGTIISGEDNLPLPGVSVQIKGTFSGVATDLDGKYNLDNVGPNTVLIFSFIGFVTQEQAVGNRSIIDVTLKTDSKLLGEVIVTGYKTQNSREVAGSINTVSAEEIREVPIASFDQALQGRAPGVLIQANQEQRHR